MKMQGLGFGSARRGTVGIKRIRGQSVPGLFSQPLILFIVKAVAGSHYHIIGRERNAGVRVLPRCGHWTPFERPEECIDALTGFYSQRFA